MEVVVEDGDLHGAFRGWGGAGRGNPIIAEIGTG
jgi:hypothetical protein